MSKNQEMLHVLPNQNECSWTNIGISEMTKFFKIVMPVIKTQLVNLWCISTLSY